MEYFKATTIWKLSQIPFCKLQRGLSEESVNGKLYFETSDLTLFVFLKETVSIKIFCYTFAELLLMALIVTIACKTIFKET